MPYDDGGVDFIFEAKRWSGSPGIGEPRKCDDMVFCFPSRRPDSLAGLPMTAGQPVAAVHEAGVGAAQEQQFPCRIEDQGVDDDDEGRAHGDAPGSRAAPSLPLSGRGTRARLRLAFAGTFAVASCVAT